VRYQIYFEQRPGRQPLFLVGWLVAFRYALGQNKENRLLFGTKQLDSVH